MLKFQRLRVFFCPSMVNGYAGKVNTYADKVNTYAGKVNGYADGFLMQSVPFLTPYIVF